MEVKSYRDLIVWQKSIELVVSCYRLTHKFPNHELYGITNQLRRCAVSIPANIAEGKGRAHLKEYLHHLSISYGSLTELETHLTIANRLDYIAEPDLLDSLTRTAEIGRMLNALMDRLSETSQTRSR